MNAKLISEHPQKTYAVVFDKGDEFSSLLGRFAAEKGLEASQLTAIGGFERATLGYFDWEKKEYLKIAVDEQVEVLSLIGDIAQYQGKPQLHAHAVVGLRDGSTRGGHVLEAFVRPTLEVILTEAPGHLKKRYHPEVGLALIDVEGSETE